MPCVRCGKLTVKLRTCSIEQVKEAFSAWSEVELEQAINTLRKVPSGAFAGDGPCRTEIVRKSP